MYLFEVLDPQKKLLKKYIDEKIFRVDTEHLALEKSLFTSDFLVSNDCTSVSNLQKINHYLP